GLPKHLRPGRLAVAQLEPARAQQREKVVPPTGVAKIPVILVNFNDTQLTYQVDTFQDLLFSSKSQYATGAGSMKQYYEQCSYGKFTVDGTVYGPVPAANKHDYYGATDPNTGNDAHAADLVAEAVKAIDAPGVNWKQYDSNGDGKVDIVAIIHQGRGEEESANDTDIWSHRWSLRAAQYYGLGSGPITTQDGTVVDDYIIMPEVFGSPTEPPYGPSAIGVFTHEFGHALGLPDLYDTDYSSQGVGNWCLMGGGSWMYTPDDNYIFGDTPALMCAWSKYALGWVTPEALSNQAGVSLPAAEDTPTVYRMLADPDGPNIRGGGQGQYFLIENRQRTGFDAGLPGDGMLIWHIDETQTSNNDDAHRLVDLEEADGLNNLDKASRADGGNRGDAGDPYPGTTQNTAFTDGSWPNSRLYDGNSSGVFVTGISASGPTMTFNAALRTPPQIGGISASKSWGVVPFTTTLTGSARAAEGPASVYWTLPDGSRVDGPTLTLSLTQSEVRNVVFHAVDQYGLEARSTFGIVAVADPNAVIVVDDDGGHVAGGQGYEKRITSALEASNQPYVVVQPPVTIDPRVPFTMIWSTADAYPTLTGEDQAFLMRYLDGGGRLFLASHELLYETGLDNDFVKRYLHVANAEMDVGAGGVKGIAGNPISDGVDVTLQYPFTDWSDIIIPDGQAQPLFTDKDYPGDYPVALSYAGAYRLVFLAFPFEAVPPTRLAPNNSATLLARSLSWLDGRPQIAVQRPAAAGPVSSTTLQWEAASLGEPGKEVKVRVGFSRDGKTWQWVKDGLPAQGSYQLDLSGHNVSGQIYVGAEAYMADGRASRAYWPLQAEGLPLGAVYNGPSPAKSSTTFYYHFASDQTLYVYDVAGRLVFKHVLPAAQTAFTWDLTDNYGRPLANGLYVWLVTDAQGKATKLQKLIIER
ncbi:MAG: M6 family metalloprotease domain-containing protein, partial [Firmicutes bacterium]|nr:M6 family metalloprotease domain-containing protein [Bacillota bacterium]